MRAVAVAQRDASSTSSTTTSVISGEFSHSHSVASPSIGSAGDGSSWAPSARSIGRRASNRSAGRTLEPSTTCSAGVAPCAAAASSPASTPARVVGAGRAGSRTRSACCTPCGRASARHARAASSASRAPGDDPGAAGAVQADRHPDWRRPLRAGRPRARPAGDGEREATIAEQRVPALWAAESTSCTTPAGSPAAASAGRSACSTIARAVPSASEPIRKTTALPVGRRRTRRRTRSAGPRTRSRRRRAAPAGSTSTLVVDRRRRDRGRRGVAPARSPAIMSAASSLSTSRSSIGRAPRPVDVGSRWPRRSGERSSSASARERSKKSVIASSEHDASSANPSTAAPTAASTSACSAAGMCSKSPVGCTTTSRSPRRTRRRVVVDRRDAVAAEDDLPGRRVSAVSRLSLTAEVQTVELGQIASQTGSARVDRAVRGDADRDRPQPVEQRHLGRWPDGSRRRSRRVRGSSTRDADRRV